MARDVDIKQLQGNAVRSDAGTAVPAVARAIAVLEALVLCRDGLSLTELAERCSLAKSTASNLLRTMVAGALVTYEPKTRRYNLGTQLVEFGLAAVTRTTAVAEARPFMDRLAEQTQLACLAIQVMPDGHFTAIAKVESRKDIKITIDVGSRFERTTPLLSRLSAAWTDDSSSQAPQEVLARIRAQGYGAAWGEYRPELNVVGFPVFDRDARPNLFVTLVGIGADLTPETIDRMAGYLVEAAHAITTSSGGKLPADYPAVGSVRG